MNNVTKAMILAAGFGTRMKPLTDIVPKALVKVSGAPMIEPVIRRLVEYGIREIVVNTHYLSKQVEEYFAENDFGVKIFLSYEKEILGTGGGIKNAGKLLKDSDAFIVHNVDVSSEINLKELVEFHFRNSAFATLAVKRRDTRRPLVIDKQGNLIGRKSPEKTYRYRKSEGTESLAGFCGIHVISSSIFNCLSEEGFFDIFTAYFRLIKEQKRILAFDTGSSLWNDLGTLDKNIHSA